jgi:HK97 family phage prohead protease
MNRAYSFLTIRSVDEEQRIITGVATTPTPDRVGDVVEPLGVKFKNPLPLLWQHRTSEPVGNVRFDKPTEDGITFQAKMPRLDEPGTLKDRIDEAWQSVKLGLVRAVSIGFRAIEFSFMKETDGIRFTETEVLELSLVTIPAQADAVIQTIKSIDAPLLAAAGLKQTDADRPKPPGATGKVNIKSVAPKDAKTMTTLEQIAGFEATRAAKAARMTEIMQKASDAGETLDQEASDEYDTLDVEVKKVDEHLVRLRNLEASNKRAAVAVEKIDTVAKASEIRGGAGPVISVKANVSPEMPFVRYCIAHARAGINRTSPEFEARKEKSWHNTPEVELALSMDVPSVLKAAIGVGTTTDATWASPLIAYQVMASEFAAFLRPLTIIGRIPGLRRVPFNIQIPRATSGTTVGWVGENAPKPVSAMAFDTITLRWSKAAGIVLLTDELVKFSSPAAEGVVRDDLAAQMVQFLDRQFIDPSVAAVTNVSPASITNGVTGVTPTGTTAAAFRADVKTLFGNLITLNIPITSGVWIMTQQQALSLSLMQNSLGQHVFPQMTPEGGTLLGYPVVAASNIPSTTGSPVEGFPIIFLIPSEILLADDGVTVIDSSREASVQLDTAPDSPPTASTAYVSLWQMNFTGLRAERWITWLKRRTGVVQFISSALYAE